VYAKYEVLLRFEGRTLRRFKLEVVAEVMGGNLATYQGAILRCAKVLLHLHSCAPRILAEVRSRFKPGGVLVLTTPKLTACVIAWRMGG
jgi:2-polyprenyl-3-methyl-5-hydroxy-6-metoxy-1,4-benzoquinol methylase